MSKILAGIVLLVMAISIVGCGGASTRSSEPIKATWITAQIADTTASIPASEIESNKMTHFMIGTPAGDMAFMAYELGEKTYVRSNVCPPCRSVGFSLEGNTLVCDTCATTFDAKTGDGIDGACVDFPKASISYEITDSNIVMDGRNLVEAYQNTLRPGLP